MPALGSIEIPNTEAMRSVANFWFAAAGTHTEKAQTLEAHAPAVSKNWQGQASQGYEQTNQKVLGRGSIYRSQMLSVANLISSTAAQFDWGNDLQAMAKRQWAVGDVLASTGQAEAAALWYASARTTQQSAVGVITAAHAAYTTGMEQLQAELPNQPVTLDGQAITYVPKGQPLSPVSRSSKRGDPPPAYTPGEKPPVYTPRGEPPAYSAGPKDGELTIGVGQA